MSWFSAGFGFSMASFFFGLNYVFFVVVV